MTTPNIKSNSGLRAECLPFTEVIAQSIANIAPSAGPALFIPSVFAVAGNGTWLTFVFSTIALVLLGINISQFAKRSASPGGLYSYSSKEFGSFVGSLTGWALIIAYLLTASAVICGFTSYGNVILSNFGVNISPVIVCLFGGITSWYVAYRDVKLSAKLMLAFEAVSLVLLLILGVIILLSYGPHIDFAQLKLQGVSANSIKQGLVLAIFSYVGFESASALGDEAKNPKKNIPRAIIISALFVGIFYIYITYCEIVGLMGTGQSLDKVDAPPVFLASKYGLKVLGGFLAIGALVSFWSCVTACMNAGSRTIFTMSRHKLLPSFLSKVHVKNETPCIAVTFSSITMIIFPIVLMAFGSKLFDIFGWLATIATFGFLFAYIVIAIGAPIYLHREKQLTISNIIISILTLAILVIAVVGSVYPLPAYPYNMFPFIFVGWMIIGGIYLFAKARDESIVKCIKEDIDACEIEYEKKVG